MTTTQIGAIAEAAITYHATKLGIVVLKPLIEGRRYDLVLDAGDLLVRTRREWARHKARLGGHPNPYLPTHAE